VTKAQVQAQAMAALLGRTVATVAYGGVDDSYTLHFTDGTTALFICETEGAANLRFRVTLPQGVDPEEVLPSIY
jgi:hypothetical protein